MPWDRGKYPPEWPAIRARILDRATAPWDGFARCERCGAPNHVYRWAHPDGTEEYTPDRPLDIPSVRIVLTIAHIHNPDPADCRDDNLAALCQRCHNRLDGPMRAANARATLRRRKVAGGQGELIPATLDVARFDAAVLG